MTTPLDGLIERVERCTGPDRELDADLHCAVHGLQGHGYQSDGTLNYSVPGVLTFAPLFCEVPTYTGSIDAALHLARDHLGGATMWSVCEMEEGPFAQLIRPMPDGGYVGGVTGSYGNSAPLAIILATLRALQSIKTSETPT